MFQRKIRVAGVGRFDGCAGPGKRRFWIWIGRGPGIL